MKKYNLGVLISGGGSNLQAILDATQTDLLKAARVALVIANKKDAFGLERAERAGVGARWMDPQAYPSREDYFAAVGDALDSAQVNLVCLAGFLLKLTPGFVARYRGKIVNIHPALLPKFGGAGMYGHHVHEAVLRAGETESGCTVHWVDEEFDHGPIIAQTRVPVLPGDTPARLAERVLQAEHALYPRALAQILPAQ